MSVRQMGLMLALAILPVAGCRQATTYAVLGKDLLEVEDPGGGNLGWAITEASHALAQSVTTQPGTVYYPSFSQTSRWWGDKNSPDISRGMTTFTDTSGRAVRIETISRRNSPTLVFIECGPSGDPLVVLNQITRSLDKAGSHR